MKTIGVAIVNYNTCEHLRECLASIERKAEEVIVVDNASTDSSVAMLRAEFPSVFVIASTENQGYGEAANRAIKSSQANYVLLLNSDTCLKPGTLDTLAAYLEKHPQAAIVGPHLVNPDGSLQASCYSFPTPLHVLLEESNTSRLLGSLPVLREHYLRTWNHRQSLSVPWVLGAALGIRRQAFLEVGGFETAYYMYAEEVDLCYRLRQAGWQTHYTPDATIVHTGGASTRQRRAEMAVQYYASLVLFYRRHYSKFRLGQLIIIMKSIVLARMARDSVRLYLTSEKNQRARIVEDLSAWHNILSYPVKQGMVKV